MMRKSILFGLFLLATIILLSNFFSAYMSASNPQTTQFFSTALQTVSPTICQQGGSDFLIQIAPFGCTPAVVRSDLLEENDVPIYCQLGATQINPLIDVSSIDSISFSGQLPKEVSGVGFYPAKAALGVQGALNSPALNNIGYVVINLKQQSNESAMPDYVSGTLTAKVKYNLNSQFGIGKSLFYLPEVNDKDFSKTISQSTFWDGKGYLRADSVGVDSAQVSVYTDAGKVSTVSLKKGETSSVVYLPGLQCQAGIKIKLEGLDNPNSRAQLRVNAEVNNVAVGEKFLNNKCEVRDLKNYGIMQQVTMRCQEDTGINTFSLTISPNITLSLGGRTQSFQLGDKVYSNGANNVYLAYIGTKGNSRDSKDLFVYLLSSPQEKNSKLSDDKIASLSHLFGDLINANVNSGTIIEQTSAALKVNAGLMNLAYKFLASGEQTTWIDVNSKNPIIFGTPVDIVGFTGPQDVELDSKVQEQYNNAIKDYDTIVTQYPTESTTLGTTYGEEALYNEITLASYANQKKTAADLCKQFIQNYPHSDKNLDNYCKDYQLSNGEAQSVEVAINQQFKKISFDGIYEPSLDDYSVIVQASTSQGADPFSLRKDQPAYLSSGNGYMQLVSINDDNSANVQISVVTDSGTVSNAVTLTKGSPNDFAKGYSFTLSKVNLKKVAKVSLTSSIDNTGTSANFSFKISIEKRAVQLSPDLTRKIIKDLNESINTWQGISATIANVTQGLKTVCLAAGVTLVAKNLLFSPGVSGLARQYVMRGISGWDEKCADLVSKGTYVSPDACFTQNADKIDADVKTISDVMGNQNAQKKLLQAGATTPGWLGEQTVDTKKYMMESNIPKVNPYLANNLPTIMQDPTGKGKEIDVNNLLTYVITPDGYNKGIFTSDQLNDIELYTRVLKDPSVSPQLKEIANARIYSDLSTLQTSAANYAQIAQTASSTGIDPSQIGFIGGKDVKIIPYLELTNGKLGNKKIVGVADNNPVYLAPAYDGNTYLFVLDDSLGIQNLPIKNVGGVLQIYDYNTMKIVLDPSSDLTKTSFQKFDVTSYKNPYKNAKLTYYETDPYKGMPAIVPFDLANGWYAATKPNVPISGNIQAYETSGRVSSFYVCNVGEGGIEENIGGNDICELINTATGQSYTAFPYLSPTEASAIISKANQAIEEASKIPESQRNGYVSIKGQKVQVGVPAALISQFQCQDFMSPTDCAIMFNLCDPVICPTSRCNLGGTYPVTDVVQSGIIGSLALCLPNFVGFGGTDFVPVCLTGIGAGIDGLLSVQSSYRDCLQESLNTGKTIGICDEIHSIYLCDFFWKQALPIANMIIPKLIETVAGQNVRGGGEYLGVATAWSTAEKSINYFVNYYGADSKNAFAARSTDVIQGETCKLFASAVVPSGADLLNSITAPDSPPQFTGRFDETPFSSVTSPPTSHYKVFYHIFAGKDSGVSYQVYLQGSSTSSYYKDTSQNLMIASGYAPVGGYATDTVDKLATSGYKQLCISINGQTPECGFKEVSTSFAVNYIKDEYLASEANQTGIKTESECISGTPSAYGLLSGNVQSAAQSAINPAIYDQGIIRICATANPGQGTDSNAGTSTARWKEVGYCDTQNVKCWIDTQSVANVIKSTTIENATLNSLSASEMAILANQNGYLTKPQFSSAVQSIIDEKDSGRKITLINNIFDKAFWSNEKSHLLLLRGDAYSVLFRTIFATLPKPVAPPINSNAPTEGLTGGKQVTPGTTITGTGTVGAKTTIGYAIWQAAKTLVANNWDEYRSATVCGTDYSCINDNVCSRFVLHAMINAGVKTFLGTNGCLQSVCTINSAGEMVFNQDSHSGWEAIVNLISTFTNNPQEWVEVSFNTEGLVQGDIVVLGSKTHNGDIQHVIIFDSYTSDGKSINGFGDPGIGCRGVWSGLNCIGVGTYPIASKLETYPVKSNDWYIYRAFRYIGDFSPAAKAMAVAAAPKPAGTPVEIPVPAEEPVRVTIREKIYQSARDIANSVTSSNDVAAKFVSRALVNAGVTGIEVTGTVSSSLPSSADYLASIIEKKGEFSEIDLRTNIINIAHPKTGDIVLIGQGCKEPYSIGIIALVPDGGQSIYVYTNLGNKVKIENLMISPSVENGIYIYKAYRYIGDLTSQEKVGIISPTEWTLSDAIIEVNKRKGTVTDNKEFVGSLIFDKLLTEKECGDARTWGIAGLAQKDMSWLKKLLLAKCGQDELCKKLLTKLIF